METIIFKIEENKDLPFIKGVKYSIDNLVKLDWNSNNSLYLTKILNQQCIISQIQYFEVETYCLYPKYFKYGNYIPSIKNGEDYKGYLINPEKLLCKQFLSNASGYNDVFIRNQKVLNEKFATKNTVDIFAVVLLERNFYYGHVFCWFSPDKSIIFMMGIQSNIINSLLENPIKGVSSYLLEAVRKFGLINGSKNISVPYPIGGMQTRLLKLGFEKKIITSEVIGNSILLSNGDCDRCVIKTNIDVPLGYESKLKIINS